MRSRVDFETEDTRVLEKDEMNRLLTHGLHEETVFYNRLNFFSVLQSVLVAAIVSSAPTTDTPGVFVIQAIAVLGLAVSGVWWYAQVSKLRLLNALGDRAKWRLHELRESVMFAERYRLSPLSANRMMAHAFPMLFAGTWVAILAWSFGCFA